IAGYFENEIPDEENSRSETEYLRIEVQCPIELKRGKSHIDPIQIRHDVQGEHEWDQALRELRDEFRFGNHYFLTNFRTSALTLSATKISPLGPTAIMWASPNSPMPLPVFPVAARTLPSRSSFRS